MSADNTAAPPALTPATDSEGPPPNWLQALLYMAAEKLAQEGATHCTFRAHTGRAEDVTFSAALRVDPVSACVVLYVHHAHTGRFVCKGQAAVVDEIDPVAWQTDLHSNLDHHFQSRVA